MDIRRISLGPTVFLGGYLTSSNTPRHPFHLTPIRSVHGKSESSPLSWPSTADELTPYHILGLQPGDPYRKSAFYERVKLYHPDRHRAVPSALTPTVRASRYRMVVAAHELLSDPHKRQAYNRWGVGWNDSNYNNTTDRVPPALRFICTRSGLLLVVIIFVFLQSCLFIVQYNKAQLRAWQVHQQCQHLLERRRTRAGDLAGLPETQLERFLLNRGPRAIGPTGKEGDVYRDMLPTCAHGPV
ncbi:J domain-containing protein 1 [Aspergillus tubingensis]